MKSENAQWKVEISLIMSDSEEMPFVTLQIGHLNELFDFVKLTDAILEVRKNDETLRD